MLRQIRHSIVPFYLLLCLVFGGASAAGHWANLGLQLLALVIIGWALMHGRATPMTRAERYVLLIAGAAVALLLVQLIPLPPGLWTSLSGRGEIAASAALVGVTPDWHPLSLDPTSTTASLMALLPPIAVLLGMLRLNSNSPRRVYWVVIVAAMVSVLVGVLQILGGQQSVLYFYEITNFNATTGFFANSNHLATLLLASVPLAGALYLGGRRGGKSVQVRSALTVTYGAIVGVVMVGLVINGSIAGLALGCATLGATAVMVLWRERPIPRWFALAALGFLALAVAASTTGSFSNKLAAMGPADENVGRFTTFANSFEAAKHYFPAGSGAGTFVEIYPAFEDPTAVSRVFVNHVHNDYIELLLETGLPGMLLLAAFLIWWVRRTLAVWLGTDQPNHFARAASIATAGILAHSFVDYPLRTAAMLTVFAACCVLMANSRRAEESRRSGRGRRSEARHLSAD